MCCRLDCCLTLAFVHSVQDWPWASGPATVAWCSPARHLLGPWASCIPEGSWLLRWELLLGQDRSAGFACACYAFRPLRGQRSVPTSHAHVSRHVGTGEQPRSHTCTRSCRSVAVRSSVVPCPLWESCRPLPSNIYAGSSFRTQCFLFLLLLARLAGTL